MAITRYSFKPVQARSQQKETLILDKELNLYRTLKNIIPCYCAVNMRVTTLKQLISTRGVISPPQEIRFWRSPEWIKIDATSYT